MERIPIGAGKAEVTFVIQGLDVTVSPTISLPNCPLGAEVARQLPYVDESQAKAPCHKLVYEHLITCSIVELLQQEYTVIARIGERESTGQYRLGPHPAMVSSRQHQSTFTISFDIPPLDVDGQIITVKLFVKLFQCSTHLLGFTTNNETDNSFEPTLEEFTALISAIGGWRSPNGQVLIPKEAFDQIDALPLPGLSDNTLAKLAPIQSGLSIPHVRYTLGKGHKWFPWINDHEIWLPNVDINLPVDSFGKLLGDKWVQHSAKFEFYNESGEVVRVQFRPCLRLIFPTKHCLDEQLNAWKQGVIQITPRFVSSPHSHVLLCQPQRNGGQDPPVYVRISSSLRIVGCAMKGFQGYRSDTLVSFVNDPKDKVITVPPVITLVGPSGSRKSTIFKAISFVLSRVANKSCTVTSDPPSFHNGFVSVFLYDGKVVHLLSAPFSSGEWYYSQSTDESVEEVAERAFGAKLVGEALSPVLADKLMTCFSYLPQDKGYWDSRYLDHPGVSLLSKPFLQFQLFPSTSKEKINPKGVAGLKVAARAELILRRYMSLKQISVVPLTTDNEKRLLEASEKLIELGRTITRDLEELKQARLDFTLVDLLPPPTNEDFKAACCKLVRLGKDTGSGRRGLREAVQEVSAFIPSLPDNPQTMPWGKIVGYTEAILSKLESIHNSRLVFEQLCDNLTEFVTSTQDDIEAAATTMIGLREAIKSVARLRVTPTHFSVLGQEDSKFDINELSGGQYDALSVLLALYRFPVPDMVLLDEPGQNLGAAERSILRDEIYLHAKESGKQVIIVTHHSELLEPDPSVPVITVRVPSLAVKKSTLASSASSAGLSSSTGVSVPMRLSAKAPSLQGSVQSLKLFQTFFAPTILLVEGWTDVQLLTEYQRAKFPGTRLTIVDCEGKDKLLDIRRALIALEHIPCFSLLDSDVFMDRSSTQMTTASKKKNVNSTGPLRNHGGHSVLNLCEASWRCPLGMELETMKVSSKLLQGSNRRTAVAEVFASHRSFISKAKEYNIMVWDLNVADIEGVLYGKAQLGALVSSPDPPPFEDTLITADDIATFFDTRPEAVFDEQIRDFMEELEGSLMVCTWYWLRGGDRLKLSQVIAAMKAMSPGWRLRLMKYQMAKQANGGRIPELDEIFNQINA